MCKLSILDSAEKISYRLKQPERGRHPRKEKPKICNTTPSNSKNEEVEGDGGG